MSLVSSPIRSCRDLVPALCGLAAVLILVGCGGHSETAVEVPKAVEERPLQSHQIGGSISGLAGIGLVITNGSDSLSVPIGSTSFVMPSSVKVGEGYALTVSSQPAGQTCSFDSGAGTMPDAAMRNAVLTCAADAFTVGGSVRGLTGNGLVLANGADTIAINPGDASFVLSQKIARGGSWKVFVERQPAGQVCSVSGGSGQVTDAPITSVQVECETTPVAVAAWRLGGTVSGLLGSGLVLANGSDTVDVALNGRFAFGQPIPTGNAYAVSVLTPPAGQSCIVANPTGTVASADVADVTVTCTSRTFTLGGSIGGLNALGLVLANGSDVLNVAANASLFTMAQPVAFGSSYNLITRAHPFGLNCTTSNGSGAMGAADVSNIAVNCASVAFQVSTLAGTGTAGYLDGNPTSAQFNRPHGIVADRSGNVFIAEPETDRIRKVAPDGTVSTFAGGARGFADGNGTSAQFNFPVGIAMDSTGNLIVADYGNHRIRKITPDGTVTTVAGTGILGYIDGSAAAAQFRFPAGVALERNGNIVVADYDNSRIRRISTAGLVTTIAGTGASNSLDGPVATAEFRTPTGIAVDSSGNIFVSDRFGHRIRKIGTDGMVTTVAGNSSAGYVDGNGAATRLNQPVGLAIDAADNLFIADAQNSRIRVMKSDGTLSTIAGDGTRAYADGPAATAKFDYPSYVAVDGSNRLVISDQQGHRIRLITP
ncbi:MAG: NHL repeat-containing protein [Xylophilus ampelinus]